MKLVMKPEDLDGSEVIIAVVSTVDPTTLGANPGEKEQPQRQTALAPYGKIYNCQGKSYNGLRKGPSNNEFNFRHR